MGSSSGVDEVDEAWSSSGMGKVTSGEWDERESVPGDEKDECSDILSDEDREERLCL